MFSPVALVLALLVALMPHGGHANDWSLLERPGAVAMMRHALAPGGGDPAALTLGDCTTQRNLNNRGREQARRIGDTLRDRGIAFDAVLSSQWCRCLDTATEMALGEATPYPPLNSFFSNRQDGPAQTDTLRQFLASQPDDRRLMLVTHQVNITALTGVFPSSGEIIVIDVAADGAVEVLGTLLIAP